MRVWRSGRSRRSGQLSWIGRGVLSAVLCLVVAGCGVSAVAFQQSQRMTITAPGGTGVMHLPLTVSWSSAYPGGTEYVLFLDQAPIPPNKTLRYVPEQAHDTSCLVQPACPDATYLNNLNIFTTTRTSYVFSTLPISANRDRISLHELTIVALDRGGRRMGESSATTSFRIPTADTGL